MNAATRRRLAGWSALLLLSSLVPLLALPAGADHGGSHGNPPSVECATSSTDPYQWNGEYWKIQVNDGALAQIETNVPGAISLSSSGSWTNSNDDAVFRIVMKAGASGSDQTLTGLWATGEGGTVDLAAQGLSHVTFCFTDTQPPEPVDVAVSVSGGCVVVGETEVGRFTVSIQAVAGNDVTVSLLGASLTNGQSVDGALDTTHSWTASSASGDFTPVPDSGTTSAASGCTPTTQPTIPPGPSSVTVSASAICETDASGQGFGKITVVVTPSNGAIVSVPGATALGNGVYTVAEGTAWTWSATPVAGFAIQGATSGGGQIGTCSTEVLGTTVVSTAPSTTAVVVSPSTLPFTGPSNMGSTLAIGMALAGLGGLVLAAVKREEEEEAAARL